MTLIPLFKRMNRQEISSRINRLKSQRHENFFFRLENFDTFRIGRIGNPAQFTVRLLRERNATIRTHRMTNVQLVLQWCGLSIGI